MKKMVKKPASGVCNETKGMQCAQRLVFILILFAGCALFPAAYSFAEEAATTIISDTLEYSSETKKYVAKGSVEIKQEDTVITADEITYYKSSSDVNAQGNVNYQDAEISIEAGKAELNLERKTGKLFDADIFYAKDNYHLSGVEIEKRGENSYYSPSAAFTTCDAPAPDWCFNGKYVDVVLGERVKAKNVSFKIKNVPVLYTPYLWVPMLTARQTGFLMPAISQSESRGSGLSVPFFWAISENRDATFMLDIYSKRGIGKGFEYRFVEPDGVMGNWWAYHIRDSELDKDFWELKGSYENRSAYRPGSFLNINYLNEKDFYRTFSARLETRTQRFLESTGELNMPLSNSRLYLLAQYRIDLKHDTETVPQKLPEAGYVLNYTKVGSSLFSASASAANMWRDGGLSARRMDIYPKLLHSFGRDFVVSQTAAVRATAYSFSRDEALSKGLQRTAFEYNAVGHARLFRNYGPFLHVIEPSVRYHFIASSENDLPVFDASELFRKTSRIELSLLNRVITGGSEVAAMRLSQEIETYNSDRPFLPLRLELGINKGFPIKLEASYNTHTGRFETISSDLSMRVFEADFFFGQRYNRAENIMLYKAGIGFSPHKRIHLNSSIWYDAKGGGVRDMNIVMRYQRQCWGLRFEVSKKPDDYTVLVMFELAGLNQDFSEDD